MPLLLYIQVSLSSKATSNVAIISWQIGWPILRVTAVYSFKSKTISEFRPNLDYTVGGLNCVVSTVLNAVSWACPLLSRSEQRLAICCLKNCTKRCLYKVL